MKYILHMPAVTYAHSSESNTMCKLVTPKLFLIAIRLRLKTYDLHLQMWICFTMFIALVVALFILSSSAVRLWSTGSVVVVRGLVCPMSCGILLDQDQNSVPCHCTEDSQPLDYLESPRNEHFNQCFNIYLLYDVYIWTKTTRNDLFTKAQVS